MALKIFFGASTAGNVRVAVSWVELQFRPAALGIVLDPLPGVIAFNGQPVGLRAARKLAAGTGAFAAAGQPVALRIGRRLAAGTGAVTVAGQSVTLRYADNQIMVAATSAFTLAGQPVTLRRTRVMPAATGVFTVAGQPVTFRYTHVMPAAKGAVALAGQPVNLLRSRVMPAAAGAVTLAGQPITLRRTYVMPAATGAVTLAGQPVGFRVGRVLRAEAGSPAIITISGASSETDWGNASFGIERIGQTFLSVGTRIDKIAAPLGRLGNPVDGVCIKVYAADASHHPTTLLGTSNVVAGSSLTADATPTVEFTFTPQITVANGTEYVWVFERTGALNDSNEYLSQITDASSYSGGIAIYHDGSSWNNISSDIPCTISHAGAGTVTLAGQPVTFRRTRVMPAAAGAFTISGQAINLRYSADQNTNMLASPGAFVKTGQPVTLRVARKLLAQAGGSSPVDIVISGTYTEADWGAAPIVSLGQTFLSVGTRVDKVAAPLGRISNPVDSVNIKLYTTDALHRPTTLLGTSNTVLGSTLVNAATPTVEFTFSPSVTTVIGTEYAWSFVRTGVADDSNKYMTQVTSSGSAYLGGSGTYYDGSSWGDYFTDLPHTINQSIAGAVVTVSGQPVTLRYARKLLAGTGAFTVTGYAVTLRYADNQIMAANLVNFALAGQPAILRYAHKMAAAKGAVTLAGQPVVLQVSRKLAVSAGAGAFVLAGQPVTLTVVTASTTLTPEFFANQNTFYGHALTSSYTITSAFYADPDNFYTQTVTSNYTIQPALYTNPDTFYTHVLTSYQNIRPELFVNTNIFYQHRIEFDQFLYAGLFVDPDTFPPAYVGLVYTDTEVLFVTYENRRMGVSAERRMMIVAMEDKSMEVRRGDRVVDSPALVPLEGKSMEVLDEENDMFAGPRERG